MNTYEVWLKEEKCEEFETLKIVRCKDFKHRPIAKTMALEFPDDICPCQIDDDWYSWMPKDDFFCANGEKKDGN